MVRSFVYKKPPHECGLGNLFIQLTSMPPECRCLHDNVYDYELSNCVVIKGFTRVSYEGEQPTCPIIINQHQLLNSHSKIKDIIEPTPHMKNLITQHLHLLEGVSAGMSIRRGSYCEDSRQYKDARADANYHYFCSDSGLNNFREAIRREKGRVFLSSDSPSTVRQLLEEFGSKLSVIDMPYTVASTQDQHKNPTIENLQKIYLKWFLLSMCPIVYITGGIQDAKCEGFSTYAYIAAVYGGKNMEVITN